MTADKGVEILLVEDNADDAEIAIIALKKNNLINNVVHFNDGEKALDYIFATGSFTGRNNHVNPKLILLDLKMPTMDGIEVLRKIKSHEHTKTIPVVILTSSNEDPDILRCYQLGANSYITKPVDFDNFMNVISNTGMYWVMLNNSPK